MSAAAAISSITPLKRLQMNRLGLWLFFASECFLFGGLLVTRFYLLGGSRPEVEQITGLVVTSILLVSSFFMARGETALAHGDRKTFMLSTAITAALGTLFLLGVVLVEWRIAPFRPWTNAAGAVFYGMTGMHAIHVLTGVVFLLVVLYKGRKGAYTAENHWGVEACAIYWHFVDVVWVFFYPALYLIGTPA